MLSGARVGYGRTRWSREAALILGLALALVVVCGAKPAAAQEGTPRAPGTNGEGMDTHLFRPAVDSKGFFSVNGTDVLGSGEIAFGLVLDWGHRLMRTRDGSMPVDADTGEPCANANCDVMGAGTGVSALIDNSFQGTLGFSYGIANMATVGISVPVIIMAGDRAYQIGNDGALYNSGQLDAQKISTVAPHLKLRLTDVRETVGVAVVAQAGVPVAGAPRDLGADPGFWYWPRVVVENRFGSTGRFRVGLDAGYRGHTGASSRFGMDPTGLPQLAEGELSYGNLATYGLGLSYRVTPTFDVVAESYGTYLLADRTAPEQKLSNEFLGGIKLFVEKNSFLMLGAGGRAFSTGFQAADTRVVLGFVFEPSFEPPPPEPPPPPRKFPRPPPGPSDRDGDGIPDHLDKCPDDPEDFDGFQDADGCPDPDNDGDGIPDVEDACPDDPETFNGVEDADGCPDKGRVIIEGSDIVILDKIQFATASAEILPESIPIVDAVAATLKGHPDLKIVEIAGHADERGADDMNLRLTQARAASVRNALVSRGIDPKRLVSQGYGEYCPLDPESNPQAWDKNRRVEFKVVVTAEGNTGVGRGCETAREKGVHPPPVN